MVRALAAREHASVASLLLDAWSGAGPEVRREMTEALMARPERVTALLDALEAKKVAATQLEPARLAQLRKTSRGAKVLAGTLTPARAKVVQEYADALKIAAESVRGKQLFAKHCAACHRLEGVGHAIGPDLLATLRGKSAEQLLIDILDPSREVDPRYLSYQVRTSRGVTFTGVIAADTATSLTLRRGEGAEDTVLRRQIESVESTGLSLMPEGFEQHLSRQDLADLLRYLQGVR
jgi:putative heme-binding domain-containing protein